MTRQDEKVALVKESGVWDEIGYPKCIEKLIDLVAAHTLKQANLKTLFDAVYSQQTDVIVAVLAEREACADLCYKDKENNIVMTHGTGKRLDMLCAAAIRARTSND